MGSVDYVGLSCGRSFLWVLTLWAAWSHRWRQQIKSTKERVILSSSIHPKQQNQNFKSPLFTFLKFFPLFPQVILRLSVCRALLVICNLFYIMCKFQRNIFNPNHSPYICKLRRAKLFERLCVALCTIAIYEEKHIFCAVYIKNRRWQTALYHKALSWHFKLCTAITKRHWERAKTRQASLPHASLSDRIQSDKLSNGIIYVHGAILVICWDMLGY